MKTDKSKQKQLTTEMKQTAVEYLEQRYNDPLLKDNFISPEEFQRAKEMEKEQIVSSYRIGRVEQTIPTEKFRTGNQHYNETYGGNK